MLVASIKAKRTGKALGFLGLVRRNRWAADDEGFWQHVLSPLVESTALLNGLRPNAGAKALLQELVGREPKLENPELARLIVLPHRLRHDVEQAAYLAERGLVDEDIASDLTRRFDKVRSELTGPEDEGVQLSWAQWERIAPYYQRVLYMPTAPRIDGPVLTARDFGAVETAYWGSSPNLVVMDDFFSPTALEALAEHALLSPFLSTRPTFVGSFLVDALGSEVLAQALEEMRAALPSLFCREHVLYNAWEFKYDDQLGRAIHPHADAAAVNFNVWLSSDEGSLDNSTGGLDVWEVLPPPGWLEDFDTFNNADSLEAILELTEGKQPVRVPFKRNRAIIFQSELIHGSQPLHWKRGYSTRRINLTLLFGKAGESQLCKPSTE